MAGGRPSSYKKEHDKIAAKMCELGATDMDLANAFDVDIRTIHRWKIKHKGFCHALKIGKEPANNMVERALYQRAVGFSHEEDDIRVVNGELVITPTIKHYPPDSTALIFFLKNRMPDQYRQNPDESQTEDAPPLTISFNVKEPVANIKTTNAKS